MEVSDGHWRTQHTPTAHASGARLVDATDVSVAERIAAHAGAFPTDVAAASAIVAAYLQTGAIDRTVQLTAVGQTRTRQVLHRCGIEDACGLTPAQRRWLGETLAGRMGLAEVQQRAGLGPGELVLGLYCLTHPPVVEVAAAVRRERYRIS
ncbi:MAG: hypothetical protein RI544_06380 [Haloquadratum sp.]|jgi:hypothetical protein|nr:hypothetical protein [Haloferacaceae archaeon]MDR9445758.1 hypothetical protein [Haloquadratum sp.]